MILYKRKSLNAKIKKKKTCVTASSGLKYAGGFYFSSQASGYQTILGKECKWDDKATVLNSIISLFFPSNNLNFYSKIVFYILLF